MVKVNTIVKLLCEFVIFMVILSQSAMANSYLYGYIAVGHIEKYHGRRRRREIAKDGKETLFGALASPARTSAGAQSKISIVGI